MGRPDKKIIHHYLVKAIEEKYNSLKNQLLSLDDDAAGETKSSVGDKYETSRAMVHLEKEKLMGSIKEKEKKLQLLSKLSSDSKDEIIGGGSLVKTSMGWIYIAISFGKLKIEGEDIFVVSLVSPMGQVLIDKKEGDKATLNGREIEILEVL